MTEESLTCHPDVQKKSPLWGESGCAKRSEHTTVREGNKDDLNTLSRIRKIPAVSTTTTSPRRGESAFTLAETQKNISLATFRGRGIKGEGVNEFALTEKDPTPTLPQSRILICKAPKVANS